MNNMLLLVLEMALATYIPRLLPFLILSRIKLGLRTKKLLMLIPYTALGALIIPGFLTATPEMPAAAVFGVGFAAIYSWYKGNLIVSVLGSAAVALVVLMLGGM
ncbi:MAG: AzlD domain-containing protein [Bacillota bacterium]